MTPWEEVEGTGRLGPAGAQLVYKLVASVAYGRHFRPPETYDHWSREAIYETAHDFIAGPGGMDRFVTIAAHSTDDGSFTRQLERAILNHLRTMGRRTDLGKLIRRLTAILESADEFNQVRRGDRTAWSVPGQPDTDNTVPHSVLATSISRVPVSRPSWTSETRDAPLADEGSYLTLMRTVLARADGAMTVPDLATVLASRVDHRRFAVGVELDAADDYEPASAATDQPTPAEDALNAAHAMSLFNMMSDRERISLAYSDVGVRELARLIGLGHTQAATIRQRLNERLADELRDDDDPAHTYRILTELCESWISDRTQGNGATSS